ncbi:hypothetical protein J4G33_16330 [Actinotalea sp. BY-33]|uniref:Uncharacterized protein n=1 Tax=Actinotalea soli TaxID=2819234 RepID=A0A939LT31_9CELL|nr:hypothetical protein [Actinotalea soli]MBO1753378.1 hypothetical protein [Actinotalea soli]
MAIMPVGAVSGPSSDPLDRRAARRSVRAEKAQLDRWRRLLRARLDLAVAAFAPPEPLGSMTWDVLPEAGHDLPSTRELSAAVTSVTPLDPVELMTRLRHLDRRLASYGAELDTALEASTERMLRQLATREAQHGGR